jgi:hypothetical protein
LFGVAIREDMMIQSGMHGRSINAGEDPGFQVSGGDAHKKNCAERKDVRKLLGYFV